MINKKEGDNESLLEVVLFILLCLAILGFLLSDSRRDRRDSLLRSKKDLEDKRDQLRELIKTKQKQFEEAEKKFSTYYRRFRVVLMLIWGVTMFLLYYFKWLSNLGDLLDFNGLILFALVSFNYLIYGEVFDLKVLNGQIQERIKNYCFNGNFNLKDDIYVYNLELNKVELRIDGIERELAKL